MGILLTRVHRAPFRNSEISFMHEIICPHCQTAFKIDEAGYADIVSQVRNSEFEHEIHERLALAEKDKQSAVQLAEQSVRAELEKAVAQQDKQLVELKARLEAGETVKQLAVADALKGVEQERDQLRSELRDAQNAKVAAEQLAKAEKLREVQAAAAALVVVMYHVVRGRS